MAFLLPHRTIMKPTNQQEVHLKMRTGRKTVLIAALAALAVMVLGVGYAVAQSDDAAAPAAGEQRLGPPGGGFGGPGGGPGGRPGKHMMGGEVLSVDGDTINIKTFRGEEKAVTVNEETKYLKPPDGEGSLADVQPGVRIGIALNKDDQGENPIAKAVIIGVPEPGERGDITVGEVQSIDGDKVVIKTADGTTKEITLPAITEGMRLGVATAPDGTVKGLMYAPPERPGPPAEADAAQ